MSVKDKKNRNYKYTAMAIAGFILGLLAGNYAPSIKKIMYAHYGLPDEEKDIIDQLDLYENYELFKNPGAIRHILRSIFVTDAHAERLSLDEMEMIQELDLYEDYTMWEESSKGNKFFVEKISEEEWEILNTASYIDDDILDYYEGGDGCEE
jgi:hypothetical protein